MTTFQDWKKVVLRKETSKKGNVIAPELKKAGDYDPDNMSEIKYSNQLLGRTIVRARTALKLKQSDLDKKCNFPINTCNSYEKGTAVYNHLQVNTMARVLNIRLPRP